MTVQFHVDTYCAKYYHKASLHVPNGRENQSWYTGAAHIVGVEWLDADLSWSAPHNRQLNMTPERGYWQGREGGGR